MSKLAKTCVDQIFYYTFWPVRIFEKGKFDPYEYYIIYSSKREHFAQMALTPISS